MDVYFTTSRWGRNWSKWLYTLLTWDDAAEWSIRTSTKLSTARDRLRGATRLTWRATFFFKVINPSTVGKWKCAIDEHRSEGAWPSVICYSVITFQTDFLYCVEIMRKDVPSTVIIEVTRIYSVVNCRNLVATDIERCSRSRNRCCCNLLAAASMQASRRSPNHPLSCNVPASAALKHLEHELCCNWQRCNSLTTNTAIATTVTARQHTASKIQGGGFSCNRMNLA